MRIGLVVPNTWSDAVESVTELGVAAERWGYDHVWVTDHVVGHRTYRPVYGSCWLEAVTCLAYLAARTSTIRFGTSILVVPYRDPVLTAKALATVDHLSGGRLTVGMGAGWSRAEFHALGRGDLYPARGRITDEAIELMRACWTGGLIANDHGHFRFREIEFDPPAFQRPHPPVWIGGGTGSSVLRRVARFADAWHPAGIEPEKIAAIGAKLDELAGRPIDRAPRISVDPAEAVSVTVDRALRYADAGCTDLVVEFRPPDAPVSYALTSRCAAAFAEAWRARPAR